MYIFEQLCFAAVFAWRLERRRLRKKHLAGIAAITAMLAGFLIFLVLAAGKTPAADMAVHPYRTILSSAFFSSLLFILVTGYIGLFCQVSVYEALYAMTCAYMGEHIAYCIRILVERITALPVTDGGFLPLFLGVNLTAAFLCFRRFAVPMIHRKHYAAPPRDTIRFMVCASLVIMVLSAVADVFGFQALHAVYALIFCLTLLYLQVERQKALARQSEADVREQLLISQKAQYEAYRANVDLVNRKCHDLKHQVEALKMLGNGSQQQKVIREIEDSVLFYDSFIKTGNEGLDTILTQKNLLCAEKEILFTCVADGRLLDFMDPVDLFVLFGNLMDNAIEAVQDLPPEKRSIQLSVTGRRGMVAVREENPTSHPLQLDQGCPVTTKEDRHNHGFGLRSMQLAAEKYDGALSCRIEDGVFLLSVVFVP